MTSQISTDVDFTAPPGTVVVMHEYGYRSGEPLKGHPKYEWDGRSVTVLVQTESGEPVEITYNNVPPTTNVFASIKQRFKLHVVLYLDT